MCLILFAHRAHPRYPLIVAANRDEAYARPSAPAGFWQDHPEICGGRDLEQGGTWLALARSGRFAAITNYRQGMPRSTTRRSRGELTRGFLLGREAPADYLRRLTESAAEYNGFSLIAGSISELWFYSNRGGGEEAISPGVHGLSNHLLDEPWPKVKRGVAALNALMSADEQTLERELVALLADRTPAPDDVLPRTGIAFERERALSASFIAGDAYGTRASTVIMVRADGDTLFIERTFGPNGVPAGEKRERFSVAIQSESESTGSGSSLSAIAR